MYLFTFVLLSLSSNTQGAFGKINEKYGQLWEGRHKRDIESKRAGLVGRGSICPLKTQGQKICRDWGFLSLSVCQTLWAEPGWCSEAGEKVYASGVKKEAWAMVVETGKEEELAWPSWRLGGSLGSYHKLTHSFGL